MRTGVCCAATSLYAITFSCIKNANRWTKDNLHSVVENGGQFYESLEFCRRLGSEDLPQSVNVRNCDVKIKYNFNTYGVSQQTPQRIELLKSFIAENIPENKVF